MAQPWFGLERRFLVLAAKLSALEKFNLNHLIKLGDQQLNNF